MSSVGAIQKLEIRAVAAEQMIQLLRRQIAEVKQVAAASTFQGEVDALKKENEELRKQIVEQKEKLEKAEAANGVLPVQPPAPGKVVRKVAPEAPAVEASSPAKPASQPPPEKKEGRKKTKEGGGPKKQPAAAAEESAPPHVGRLDMRVGLIRSAKKHPDADALYVEEVDVGEEKPRTVISGLVKFIPLEEMQNRPAILLCNLKPSKMRGIMSEAMVMCASTPEKVEILCPPADSKPGDVVEVEGFERRPDAQLNPKKKIFEACAPDLKVNADLEATYKGVPWTVGGKRCKAPSLSNVQIK